VVARGGVAWIMIELHRRIRHHGALLGPHRHATGERQQEHDAKQLNESAGHQK
jgi:hypothetical protein